MTSYKIHTLGRLSTYASSELFQPIGVNTIMVCYTLGLLCASHYAYESFGINKMEVAVSVFMRLLEFDKSFSQWSQYSIDHENCIGNLFWLFRSTILRYEFSNKLCFKLIFFNEKIIFHWYLIPFLLEAVEASLCYFFKNWLMKLKFPNLLNPLWMIIQ